MLVRTVKEDMFMKRLSIIAAGLLVGAAALQFSGVASGLGDKKMGDWTPR